MSYVVDDEMDVIEAICKDMCMSWVPSCVLASPDQTTFSSLEYKNILKSWKLFCYLHVVELVIHS